MRRGCGRAKRLDRMAPGPRAHRPHRAEATGGLAFEVHAHEVIPHEEEITCFEGRRLGEADEGSVRGAEVAEADSLRPHADRCVARGDIAIVGEDDIPRDPTHEILSLLEGESLTEDASLQDLDEAEAVAGIRRTPELGSILCGG